MNYNNLYLVIPAYEPNNLLIDLVNKLNQTFLGCKIVVINDGSRHADDVFKSLKEVDNVTLLENEVNKGKGYTLKKGFSYINSLENDDIVVITCDADGQHQVEDIKKIADFELANDFNGIVLGSRKFKKDMPLRSKFGNQSTVVLFRIVNGVLISDNQTGLRAFKKDLLPVLINIKGNKYEYEMNMLSVAVAKEIPITEIKIEAIYIDNNSSSHFRVVRDYLRIVGSILKYAIPRLLIVLLEIGLFILSFYLFSKSTDNTFLSIVLAGAVSGLISIGIFLLFHLSFRFKKDKKGWKFVLVSGLAFVTNSLLTGIFYLAFENIGGAKAVNELVLLVLASFTRRLILPKPKII